MHGVSLRSLNLLFLETQNGLFSNPGLILRVGIRCFDLYQNFIHPRGLFLLYRLAIGWRYSATNNEPVQKKTTLDE